MSIEGFKPVPQESSQEQGERAPSPAEILERWRPDLTETQRAAMWKDGRKPSRMATDGDPVDNLPGGFEVNDKVIDELDHYASVVLGRTPATTEEDRAIQARIEATPLSPAEILERWQPNATEEERARLWHDARDPKRMEKDGDPVDGLPGGFPVDNEIIDGVDEYARTVLRKALDRAA